MLTPARNPGSSSVRFERWPARPSLPDDASQASILERYAADIAWLRDQRGNSWPPPTRRRHLEARVLLACGLAKATLASADVTRG